ncbi:MAG: hypothetical protein NZ529_05250, partial [Cytophagaceae bacterium]|nr:hypothetical protein [Cytophagaceae bacterium]MDW8456183.1 hypothetical protein [Cytophagaceae bacterium]
CARDGSHGLQGQCRASAEHRSDSGVVDSPAPQGRAQQKNCKLFSVRIRECIRHTASTVLKEVVTGFIKFTN